MAEEEKEHPATARQRQRFADRGDVVQTKELSAALLVACTGAVVWATAGAAAERLAKVVRICLTAVAHPGTPLWALATDTYWQVMRPVLCSVLLVVFTVALIKQRGAISFKTPKVDLGRLNPASKLASLLGGGSGFKTIAKSFLKMLAVAAVCASLLWQRLPMLLQHVPASLAAAGSQAIGLIGDMFWRGSLALVLLAAWESWRSWVLLERRMTMSGQEVRDEAKDQLGDPQVRGRIRSKARELLKKHMLAMVPKADVVVVNPTHVAVALLWDEKKMVSPQVVAKGAGDWAERIRAVARRHGVPVVTEPPLARLLHRRVNVGESIPGELYQAVAVVLAHIYRLRRRIA